MYCMLDDRNFLFLIHEESFKHFVYVHLFYSGHFRNLLLILFMSSVFKNVLWCVLNLNNINHILM